MMISFKYISRAILFVVSFQLISCVDFVELNNDPNNPTTTDPSLLLTTVCWDLFSDHSNFPIAQRMIVSSDGESSEQYYNWTRGDFDQYSKLRDVEKLEEEGLRVSNNSYVALAKFFKANYFYNLTLTFGDIPFSEALQGESDDLFTPKYDTQESVFEGILTLLEDADQLLLDEVDIYGDILNDGDLLKWRKVINSFRLKVLITLSNRSSVGAVDVASEFALIYDNSPIVESLEEGTYLTYLDQSGSRYGNFNSSSFGSGTYMDSTFIQQLVDREDPRLFVYATQTTNSLKSGLDIDDFSSYEGGDPTVQYSKLNDKAIAGDISKPHSRYYQDPVCEQLALLGYPEVEFIIAEAIIRGWISGDAKAAYNRGIEGSFQFFANQSSTSEYAEYLTSDAAQSYLLHDNVDLDQVDNRLKEVLTQKYLQSYFQGAMTSFFDQRRTGYPEFITATGVTVPNRWIYPQSEYDYNNDNVQSAVDSQFGGQDEIREIPWYLK